LNRLPHLCIDPHLLALPNVATSTKDNVEDYVSSIVDWSKTVMNSGTNAFVSSNVLAAIDSDGAFPWRDRLGSVLRHYQIQTADSRTVSDVIQYLIGRQSIEDAMGLNGLLLEENNTKVDPLFVCKRLSPRTLSAFVEMLAMLALNQHGYGDCDNHVVLASIPGGPAKPKLQYVSYCAEVVDVEWRERSHGDGMALPYAINDQLSVFFSRDGLLESVEPLSLWLDSADCSAAQDAIDCCVIRLIAAGADGNGKRSFGIGPKFLASAQAWDCGREGRHAFTLIESCARIVLNIPKHEVKEFLDSDGIQRVRTDGALAYRTHITKKGVGLRLMLWNLPDGTIEFANVGGKNELKIQ
jgi:hypothetical protein